MRWGLIPHWASDTKIGARMINARAETVAEKPTFRDALRRRRCLVLADGFYEWQRTGAARRPMRIILRTGEPFAFAGLWSVWRDPDGNRIPSCAIITTVANDLLRPIHGRMPVILPREMEEFWLDGSVEDPVAAARVSLSGLPESREMTNSPLVHAPLSRRPIRIVLVLGALLRATSELKYESPGSVARARQWLVPRWGDCLSLRTSLPTQRRGAKCPISKSL